MSQTIGLLITIITLAFLPFAYLQLYGIAAIQLDSHCLKDQLSQSADKLCVSCFYPSKDRLNGIRNQNSLSFLKYHSIEVISKPAPTHLELLNQKPDEEAIEKRLQIKKNLNRHYGGLRRRASFRIFSVPPYTQNTQFQCQQFLQMFNYASFNMDQSLDYLHFQHQNVPSLQQIQSLLSIDFLTPRIKTGKYQFVPTSLQNVNIGIVFKEPKEAQNYSLIYVQYLGYEGAFVWHVSQAIVFVGCLAILLCRFFRKEKNTRIILLVNVTILISFGAPQILKLINLISGDSNIADDFIFDSQISKFGLSLFICLCFKKINANKWVLTPLILLLSFPFNLLIYYVIIFIAIIIFIGYSSMFLQFQNYSIFLGSCLILLILTTLYRYAFHDEKIEVVSHIVIMGATGLIQIIGAIAVQDFKEYKPLNKKSQESINDFEDEEDKAEQQEEQQQLDQKEEEDGKQK